MQRLNIQKPRFSQNYQWSSYIYQWDLKVTVENREIQIGFNHF